MGVQACDAVAQASNAVSRARIAVMWARDAVSCMPAIVLRPCIEALWARKVAAWVFAIASQGSHTAAPRSVFALDSLAGFW